MNAERRMYIEQGSGTFFFIPEHIKSAYRRGTWSPPVVLKAPHKEGINRGRTTPEVVPGPALLREPGHNRGFLKIKVFERILCKKI